MRSGFRFSNFWYLLDKSFRFSEKPENGSFALFLIQKCMQPHGFIGKKENEITKKELTKYRKLENRKMKKTGKPEGVSAEIIKVHHQAYTKSTTFISISATDKDYC
jgi:NADPH-dependent glutamate synthase beta subunit-like oxidoreductase